MYLCHENNEYACILRLNEYEEYEHVWLKMGMDVGYICEYDDWF